MAKKPTKVEPVCSSRLSSQDLGPAPSTVEEGRRLTDPKGDLLTYTTKYWSIFSVLPQLTWRIFHYFGLHYLFKTASLLLCFFTSLLLYFFASLLLCFFASLLLCFFASLLLCFFASLLLYFFTSLLLYFFTSLLLYFFTSVLLYFCTSVLLYFCTSVLLYFCTS